MVYEYFINNEMMLERKKIILKSLKLKFRLLFLILNSILIYMFLVYLDGFYDITMRFVPERLYVYIIITAIFSLIVILKLFKSIKYDSEIFMSKGIDLLNYSCRTFDKIYKLYMLEEGIKIERLGISTINSWENIKNVTIDSTNIHIVNKEGSIIALIYLSGIKFSLDDFILELKKHINEELITLSN